MDEGQIGEGWGDVEQMLKSAFIKLSDDPIVVQFDCDPVVRKNHWMGGRPTPCEGPECPYCVKFRKGDENYRPKVKALFQCRAVEDGEWQEGRKLDLSMAAVKVLKEIKDRLGEDAFKAQAIECSKSGAGGGTKYHFTAKGPAKGHEPDAGDEQEIPF